MNEQQIEIAEEILRRLKEKNREVHSSDLFDAFDEVKYQGLKMVTRLLHDHGLVKIREPVNRGYDIWITAEGLKAYKMGLEKYFKSLDEKDILDSDQKKTSIKSSIKNNNLSLAALVLSLIFNVVLVVISSTKTDQNPEKGEQGNHESRQSEKKGEIGIDPNFIEAIRDSLLHDSVFIRKIKKLHLTDYSKN